MVQMFNLPQKTNLGSIIGQGLGQGIGAGLGHTFQNQYNQGQQQQLQQREMSALQQIMSQAGDDPNSMLQAVLQSPLSHETKKLAIDSIQNQENLRLKQEEIKNSANKPPALNKFSPLPPEQQEIVRNFLTDPAVKDLNDVDWYAEGVRRNIPPGEMDRLTKVRNEEKKTNIENQKYTRQEQIRFHEESKEVDKEITESAKRARNQVEVVKDALEAVESGKIKPSSMANVFKSFGEIGQKISTAILSKEQATLEALIPQLLEGWKDIFGVRLSDADLKILQDKLPSIGKSPEANKAVLKVIEKYAKPSIAREEIAREIKKENGGLRPLNYADKIEQEYQKRTQKIKVRDKKTGQVGSIVPKEGWQELYERAE